MTDPASSVPDHGAALDADLENLGAGVEWIDVAAGAAARNNGRAAGRLAELGVWLASTRGSFPSGEARRPRCVVFGAIPDVLPGLATSFAVGLQSVGVDPDASMTDAVEFGAAIADDEADRGTDLIVAVDPDDSRTCAVLVGLLTGAEPVSLLPRGAQATDTGVWIERAEYLRDTRRRVAGLRSRPGELLTALAHPELATTVAFILRAAARRMAVVLDGTAAVAAGLLAADIQSRASGWFQIADTAPDPVHVRAARELDQRPVLDLGLPGGDGTAGVLALAVLRAAALTSSPSVPGSS